MSDKSGIEWTDATWTIAVGCTRVSAGCDNCKLGKRQCRTCHKNREAARRAEREVAR